MLSKGGGTKPAYPATNKHMGKNKRAQSRGVTTHLQLTDGSKNHLKSRGKKKETAKSQWLKILCWKSKKRKKNGREKGLETALPKHPEKQNKGGSVLHMEKEPTINHQEKVKLQKQGKDPGEAS